VLVSLAFLAAVGFGAFAIGRDLGEIPPVDDPLAEAAVSPAPGRPAGSRIDLATARVDDFDPRPAGDGVERKGAVPNAVDDDASTAWETERYSSASFGGLKPGVGLLVDLGKPTRVGRVEMVTTGGGVTFELRTADQRGERVEDYRVVANGRADKEALVLTPAAGTSGRYYLVWITGLRDTGGDGFTAAITELRFFSG
jgi:hypothetical protein